MVLSEWWWLWSLTLHNAVTIGIDDHCDFSPLAIQDVVAKYPHVRVSNQVDYPKLIIDKPLQLWGGFANCQAAKHSVSESLPSRFLGHGQSAVIQIRNEHPKPIKIHLKNLNLRFGHSENGAGIKAQGHYHLTLSTLLIENNQAKSQGGGLHLSGEFNQIFITDSNIRQNYANHGAGVYVSGQNNHLTLNNTQINDNHAAWFGHVLACDGPNWIEIKQGDTIPPYPSHALDFTLECHIWLNHQDQAVAMAFLNY